MARFNVGDQVQVTKDGAESATVKAGDTGTVKTVNVDSQGDVYVVRMNRDGGINYTFHDKSLEAVGGSDNGSAPANGAEALEQVTEEAKKAEANKLKNLLRQTIRMASQRQTTIKVYTRQLNELEEIQKNAVKLYDAGELEATQLSDLNEAIQKIDRVKP